VGSGRAWARRWRRGGGWWCRQRLAAKRGLISEELDGGAVLVQRDDGLFPAGQLADLEAVAPLLALAVLRPHLVHAHVEHLLDGRLDLQLARPLVDPERVGVAVLRLVRALLGDDRGEDDLVGLQLRALLVLW